MPGHQPQTDFRLVADKAANVPNPMYSSKADKMPRHRAQTDWMSVADKAAKIPNPSYVTRAGATEPQGHPGEWRPTEPGPTGSSGPPGKTGAQGLTGSPRPNGPPEQPAYTRCRETCYKVFNTRKNFKDANTTCHKDGGSLAMPRDAETNSFLGFLVRSDCTYWIGLNDLREEGSFEWVDGSAPGKYNSWRPGEPNRQYMDNQLHHVYETNLGLFVSRHYGSATEPYKNNNNLCQRHEVQGGSSVQRGPSQLSREMNFASATLGSSSLMFRWEEREPIVVVLIRDGLKLYPI
ncbi:hypothetical protein Bbelb_082910 [Branchiostoma belcheri]|nr:hypothetical protein Bbelb_082910 [Branchiostoma belcheri]